MFGDRTFDRQESIEIAEKIRTGEGKFYVDYKYIEASCCSGPTFEEVGNMKSVFSQLTMKNHTSSLIIQNIYPMKSLPKLGG